MEHFSTEYMAMFTPIQEYKPINGFDPVKVLVNRRNNCNTNDEMVLPSTIPSIEYDPKDVSALEEFCRTHGILSANFGNMNPKSALSMLKTRMGIRENQSKRGLLNG